MFKSYDTDAFFTVYVWFAEIKAILTNVCLTVLSRVLLGGQKTCRKPRDHIFCAHLVSVLYALIFRKKTDTLWRALCDRCWGPRLSPILKCTAAVKVYSWFLRWKDTSAISGSCKCLCMTQISRGRQLTVVRSDKLCLFVGNEFCVQEHYCIT